jgi:aquaporin Z
MHQVGDGSGLRWRLFAAELVGTAVLLMGGLSIVIFMFGAGSPMEQFFPDLVVRQVITGFLFGCVGATIAVSTIGKESGAHVNPAVTLAFWLMHKLDARTAVGYACAQLLGAAWARCPFWRGARWGEAWTSAPLCLAVVSQQRRL